MSVQLIDVHPK